jgi:hypothetical protein
MNVVFGVQEPLPLRGFPQGRYKIKMRNTDFARVFVRSKDGIREFCINEVNGYWEACYEQASNTRKG